MAESKHTPGDWRYGVRRDGSMWLSLGDPRTGPHYQGDLVASEPDARLIAAAPELLRALDELVDALDEGYVPQQGGNLLKDARAAIAKAEGRS